MTSISATTSASSSTGVFSSSDLSTLERKLHDLATRLEQAASGSGPAQAKQQEAQRLQAQMLLVRQHIDAIQHQKQQEQLEQMHQLQAKAFNDHQPDEIQAAASGTTAGLGGSVDTYA